LYAGSVARGGLGSNAFIGARSFALLGLIGVCWGAASFRSGRSLGAFIGLACLVATALSLSRLALVAALLVLVLSGIKFDRVTSIMRSVVLLALVATVAWIGTTRANPIATRFQTGDVVQIHGYAVNTNGRAAIW